LFSNKLLQTTTNSTENNRSTCGYNKESINRDTVISSPGKSDTNDDNLYNISSNFITKAVDLLYYCKLLPDFKDILAQEELLLLSYELDNVTPSISKSSTAAMPVSSPSPPLSNSD
jgi:hypothetical protein